VEGPTAAENKCYGTRVSLPQKGEARVAEPPGTVMTRTNLSEGSSRRALGVTCLAKQPHHHPNSRALPLASDGRITENCSGTVCADLGRGSRWLAMRGQVLGHE
jgi:hypothetical protein